MTVRIRAHYDGKTIVPDEPVDLPVNHPLDLSVVPVTELRSELSDQQWFDELDQLASLAVVADDLPDEALRRENLYDDRGR